MKAWASKYLYRLSRKFESWSRSVFDLADEWEPKPERKKGPGLYAKILYGATDEAVESWCSQFKEPYIDRVTMK